MKRVITAICISAAAIIALAQTPAPAKTGAAPPVKAGAAVVTVPTLSGKTSDGKPFNLQSLRGKVVLLMYWSTDCAVCRDKMPELRQNYAGWHNKPFELVLVSTDRRMQDVDDYEKIISSTVPLQQRFVQLWAGEQGYRDNLGKQSTLPMAFLLDKTGKVVERYSGRIPPEAWDKIAELL